jgi:hypothetical protein
MCGAVFSQNYLENYCTEEIYTVSLPLGKMGYVELHAVSNVKSVIQLKYCEVHVWEK